MKSTWAWGECHATGSTALGECCLTSLSMGQNIFSIFRTCWGNRTLWRQFQLSKLQLLLLDWWSTSTQLYLGYRVSDWALGPSRNPRPDGNSQSWHARHIRLHHAISRGSRNRGTCSSTPAASGNGKLTLEKMSAHYFCARTLPLEDGCCRCDLACLSSPGCSKGRWDMFAARCCNSMTNGHWLLPV